jgi:hypothetical protein
MPSPLFSRYIGIGYSGAETASSSLKGLRVYMAGEGTAPEPCCAAAWQMVLEPARHRRVA